MLSSAAEVVLAQLGCPNCGAPYAAAEVNLSLGVASCAACGQVHDLATRRRADAKVPPDAEGLEVLDGAVRYSWRSAALVFLLVWCAVWDTVSVAIVGSALTGGSWDTALFCTPHLLIGVGVTPPCQDG